MNVSHPPIQKMKAGSCPHGMPFGACPICNGGGGGSGGAKKVTAKPAGEMSWDECFAVGQMIKAQKLIQQQKDIAMQGQLHVPINVATRLENLSQKIAIIADKITDFAQKIKELPKIISKPLEIIANKILVPLLNILKDIPLTIQKSINFVKEKLADISDKLNAVFGELKNGIEKKISDKFQDFKKKFKSLFGVFEPLRTTEEEKRIEESKRLFNLKTVFQNIRENFKKPKENIENGS